MEDWEAFRAYLRPGERLLWSGRPDPYVTFSPADVFLIPFSLMWGGFALFWEFAVVSSGGPLFFDVWGLGFVAIGLYFIFGRFVYKKHRKLLTRYAVTDQRAIVVVNDSSLSDTPLKYQPVNVRRGSSGHATVVFGRSARSFSTMYANSGMEFFDRSAGCVAFFDVADAEPMLQAVEAGRAP